MKTNPEDLHLLERAGKYLIEKVIPNLKEMRSVFRGSAEREFLLNLAGALLRVIQPTRNEVEALLQKGRKTVVLPSGQVQNIIDDTSKREAFMNGQLSEALQVRFRDLAFAGKGGMGFVLKAFDITLHREVALKFTFCMEKASREQFLREGKSAGQLGTDPHVVAVLDTGVADLIFPHGIVEFPYLVLEYIPEAQDLRWLLNKMAETRDEFKRQGRERQQKLFPTSTLVILAEALAEGLRLAHQRGIIHRDMKPENVLLTKAYQEILGGWLENITNPDLDMVKDSLTTLMLRMKPPKLADFGLSGIREKPQKDAPLPSATSGIKEGETLSDSGTLIGTLYFIPPEAHLTDDPKTVGKPGDVYALGLILYMLFTGHDNPLLYSRGVKKEEARAAQFQMPYYALRVGNPEDHTPLIAGPEKDPCIRDLLGNPAERHEAIVQMLQQMTAKDPNGRPSIEKVQRFFEQEVKKRSPEAKKLRRANRIKRILKWVAFSTSAVVLSCAASIPFILAQRHREGIRKEHQHTLEDITHHLQHQDWAETIMRIDKALGRLEENNLPEQERVSMRLELQHLRKKAEVALRKSQE